MEVFHQSLQKTFGVAHSEVEAIGKYFKPYDCNKENYLLKKGKYCDFMLFVSEGYVRLYSDYQQKEVTQWISGPGYFLTELSSFLFGQKSRWNMQALSDVHGYCISLNDYNELKQEFPNWPEIEKQFIAHCFISIENRVNQLISTKAEERYLAFFQENKTLFNLVPQQYHASMLGMSPETLSRIRAKNIS